MSFPVSRASAGIALLASLFCISHANAQTPHLDFSDPDKQVLIGETACATIGFDNTGAAAGYAPYFLMTVPPELTTAQPTFLGNPVNWISLGIIDGSGQVVDPITGASVPGAVGGEAWLVNVPVGAVFPGQPPLEMETCFTVEPGSTIGNTLAVNYLPGFRFGDTPTGDNGPIQGALLNEDVTPLLERTEKTSTVIEGERPPGPSHEFDYVITTDISEGAILDDFAVLDSLPPEIQWTGAPIGLLVANGAGCGVTTEPNLPPVAGGDVLVECQAATGTPAELDVQITIPVYITDVLDESPAGPDSLLIENTAEISYSFDSQPYVNDATDELTAVHVEAYKSVAPELATPGSTVTFTVDFSVTDYPPGEGLSDLVLFDTLGDGLAFIDGSVLTVGGNNYPVTPSTAAGANPGETDITWDIGAAVSGGGGSINVAGRGSLTYQATVLTQYANGEPVVSSDALGNAISLEYTHTDGATGSNDSAATIEIVPVTSTKTIIAPQPMPSQFMPGDTITFRLAVDVPSGKALNLQLTDYFPAPAILVDEINLATDWVVAPAPFLQVTPTVTINSAANSLTVDWGDIDEPGPVSLAVDVTVDVTPVPFADGLHLTNLIDRSNANSAAQIQDGQDGVPITVGAPSLVITKGVIDGGNPNATLVPAWSGPASDELADSDVEGVDAFDNVQFAITIENQGSEAAHNVNITDLADAALNCAAAPVSVSNGLGQALAYSGDFGTSVVLDDPLPGNDGDPQDGGAPFGADTAIIVLNCTLAQAVVPGQTLENTASVVYTSTPQNSNPFPAREDIATVTIAEPTVTKTVTGVEPGYTFANSNGNRGATIGEIIEYTVEVTIPEGTSPDAQIRDLLDQGLAVVSGNYLLPGGGASTLVSDWAASAALSTDYAGGFEAAFIDNASTTSQGNAGNAVNIDRVLQVGSGTNSTGLGTVTNSNADNGTAETLTFSYRVLVLNWSSNQRGANRNNQATWSWADGNDRPSVFDRAPNVQVREPGLQVTKSFTPNVADEGQPTEMRIQLQHIGASNSPAFNVRLEDLLANGLVPVANTLVTEFCTAAPDLLALNGQLLEAEWTATTFPVGSACTLVLELEIAPPLASGETVINCAQATWHSLDATATANLDLPPGNILVGPRTGDTNDSGGNANDYRAEGCANLDITNVDIRKNVTDSTQAHTVDVSGREDLAIGEEVTFTLVATLPEGDTDDLRVIDELPYTNATLELLTATLETPPASLQLPGALPSPSVSDQFLGDSIDDTVEWFFPGTITNPPDGQIDDNDRLTFTITARVRDLPANQNLGEDENLARVQFGPGINSTDNAPIRIVEPILQVTKSADRSVADAGDTVTYTLRVEHQGVSAADGFDLILSDTLPPELNAVANSAAVGADCPAAPDNGPTLSGNTLSADWTTLAVGDYCDIEYQAVVDVTAITGDTLTNETLLNWASLDDQVSSPDERVYEDESSWDLDISEPGVIKSLVDSDIDETETGLLTIGEVATFHVTVEFPDGTSVGAVVGDQLPFIDADLEVVSSQILSIGADITASQAAVGDPGDECGAQQCMLGGRTWINHARWELGDVVNQPNPSGQPLDADDTITFEVVAIVKDLPINQGPPGGVDFLFNDADLTVENQLPKLARARFSLVEPRLEISHEIVSHGDSAPAEAAQSFGILLTVEHDATSSATAFGVMVEYVLDLPNIEWVDDSTVSEACGGITIDSSMLPTVTFTLDTPLGLNADCVIGFEVRTANNMPVEGTFTNSATLHWESAPGSVESREGIDADDVQFLASADGSLGKRVASTSLGDTGSGQHDPAIEDLAIGERVEYELLVTLDEGTTPSVQVTDTLPDSAAGRLQIESGSVVRLGSNISTSLPGTAQISGNTITFDLGEVVNIGDQVVDENDQIVLSVLAQVIDDNDDPHSNADGVVLTNEAVLTFGQEQRNASVDIEVVEPELAVVKTFGAVTDDTVELTLTISNTGTAPAFEARLTDAFDEASFVPLSMQPVTVPDGWTLDQSSAGGITTVALTPNVVGGIPTNNQILLPGGSKTVTFTMDLVRPAPVTTIDNTAELVAWSLTDGGPDAREYGADGQDQLTLPALDATKTWTAPQSPVLPGQTIRYTVTISNTGDAPANNLVIDDAPDSTGEFQAGSVSAPGGAVLVGNTAGDTAIQVTFDQVPADGSVSFSYDVTVPSPYPAGTIEAFYNQAVVASDEQSDFDSDDPATTPVDDVTIVPILADPVMDITKTSPVSEAAAGSTIVYTVAYGNIGDQDATGVVITDQVPAYTSFNQGASSTGWSCADGSGPGTECQYTVGDLAGSGGGQLLFAVDVDIPLPTGVNAITNVIEITDDGTNSNGIPSTDSDDDVVPLGAVPALQITKDDGGVTTAPDGTVVYQLEYQNIGPRDATGVVIEELVPAHTRFDAAASAPYTWDCADGSPPLTVCRLAVGTLQGNSLDIGQALFAVRVDAALPAGIEQLQNVVRIEDDGASTSGVPNVDIDSDNTPVDATPDMVVVKDDGGVIGRPGGLIRYQINWSNVGNQGATGVVLEERVPVGTRYVAEPGPNSSWSCPDDSPANTVCTQAIGAADVGSAGMATFTVRVDDPLPPGQSEVYNTVLVADDGANGPDPTPPNNSDAVGTLATLFAPTGRKSARSVTSRRVEWSMTWFNNQNLNDLPVLIVDPIPDRAVYVGGSVQCIAHGASQCLDATYNAALDRIEVTAIIAEDFGQPDNATEAMLNNEIEVRFLTDSQATSANMVNVADAYWDENNSGDAQDDFDMGQAGIEVSARVTVLVPVPGPGDRALWLLVLLCLVTGAAALRLRQAG